jgi:hypothetical protein
VLDVDRDPGALHPRQHRHQRQLHVVEKPRAALGLQLPVQRVGQVDDRSGPAASPRLQPPARRRRRTTAARRRSRCAARGAGTAGSGRRGRTSADRAGRCRRTARCRW